MSLTPGFASPRDLLEKLARDLDLMRTEVTADRFFNFAVTGYSVCDWVDHDPSVPASAKSALMQFRTGTDLKVCRDIANSLKHFSLDAKNQAKAVTNNTASEQGFGVGRYGVGAYGIGEEEITIVLNDGTSHDALALAARVLQQWESFFSAHGI
ncbi:hypothetical protein SAMN05446635_8987 [Burkholderia sp. OK233]|nr:hypothetical protein SAMN05446635_8987 [Burkholderia sp. OK233]